MKPKPDADLELLSRPKSRSWHRSFRSLGRLMTLAALSGLALAAYSERWRPKPSVSPVRSLVFRQRIPGTLQQSPVPSFVDPSIIVAPPGIDEAMIVTAREGIDEAMIVNPLRLRTGPSAPRPAQPILPPAGSGRVPLNAWPMAPRAQPPR
jgi:hypothetical protein